MAPSQAISSGLTTGDWITILLFLLAIIGSLVGLIYANLARKMDRQATQTSRMSSWIVQIATKLNIKLEDYEI